MSHPKSKGPQFTEGERPECCDEATEGIVQFRYGDSDDGPEDDGFAIHADRGDETVYVNVAFCPYCGSELPT